MNEKYGLSQYKINSNPVLAHLKHGQANAISRQALKELTGISDRAIRQEIQKLRNKGIYIVSTSDSKGYYLAETNEEVRHFVAESRSRAMELLNTANKVQIGYFNRNQISF